MPKIHHLLLFNIHKESKSMFYFIASIFIIAISLSWFKYFNKYHRYLFVCHCAATPFFVNIKYVNYDDCLYVLNAMKNNPETFVILDDKTTITHQTASIQITARNSNFNRFISLIPKKQKHTSIINCTATSIMYNI